MKTKTKTSKPKPTRKPKHWDLNLYWLIHHGRLLEQADEPIKHRIEYIKADKPTHERAIRLKWMRRVQRPDLLPALVIAHAKHHDNLDIYNPAVWKARRGPAQEGVSRLSH